jgi:hypothetical protein
MNPQNRLRRNRSCFVLMHKIRRDGIDFARLAGEHIKHWAKSKSKGTFQSNISCINLEGPKASLDLDFRARINALWSL